MECMNAVPLEGKKVEKVLGNPRYGVEEKIRGIRALLHISHLGTRVITRGGNDITHLLPHVAKAVSPDYIVLDCELFRFGWDDAKIAGLLNYRTTYSIECEEIKPYIFDIPSLGLKLEFRRRALSAYLPWIDRLGWRLLPMLKDLSSDEILTFYSQIIAEGGEGIMIKNLDALYLPGKRPQNNWFKLKYSQSWDVVICDYTPGEGKYKGMVGAIIYGLYNPETDSLIPVGRVSGFNDSQRESFTKDPEAFKGWVIEVEGSGLTEAGCIENPRFKRFRQTEKRKEECTCLE